MLQVINNRLTPTSETPALDAQVLLANVLELSRAWVLSHPEVELSSSQAKELESKLKRLESGEPLPYVLGHWEFFGLDFLITPDVLIPRPETELLVENALEWLRNHPGKRSVVDVGAGSGCIGVALAVNVIDLQLTMIDISMAALQTAVQNALRHDISNRVRTIRDDLLSGPGPQFDLICANLPYIPTEALIKLKVAQNEPRLALDGGPDGLSLIRRLILQAPWRLRPGGLVLLEIEAGQGEAVLPLAGEAFPQAEIRVIPDLSSHPRLLRVAT